MVVWMVHDPPAGVGLFCSLVERFVLWAKWFMHTQRVFFIAKNPRSHLSGGTPSGRRVLGDARDWQASRTSLDDIESKRYEDLGFEKS
jgi:hypothetical protein